MEKSENQSPPQSRSQETHSDASGSTRPVLRVYLVEDSPHVRDLLLDFLNIPGEMQIVGDADTEAGAVAAILADPVDAVIVDLKLREGSGMAVIEKLRRADLNPQPKIIVFTNHPFPEIRKRAMQLGADYFFDKSADYDSMRTTLLGSRAQ
ncbi:MAG: response regulator transcription factor [Burkholderiales bacterium]|nr:response regulator transcription factor [Burkholderiales bacterium]